MANPQCENGYTKIANDIMDALIKYRIPGEKWKVLLCILRNTYGWNCKQAELSYRDIALSTGLKRANVQRSIKWLYSNLIICVIKTDYRSKQVYEFNKNYDEWKPFKKKMPVIKSDYKSVIKTDTEKQILPIIVKKKKKRENDFAVTLYEFYKTEINPLRKTKKSAIKNVTFYLKEFSFEDLKKAIQNYKEMALKSERQYRKNPSNFFGRTGDSERYFEDYLNKTFQAEKRKEAVRSLPNYLTPEKLAELNS